ncbi:Concanavalin A-like lectin/glucanases domain-containing protein [Desulfonema magnum]|uniref:Concanavalin A-like lectin/glucanases domain-containing protein n=1 Tax=Desulfonema magnum TaxID=45655 RepID=A0A975GPV1_9BACT|nr:Concanavalin A-like lectin/glucanases domain-containing protein [Desulfonema magnum]
MGSITVLDLDGADDYIEVPYEVLLNPSQFTVEAWVKVEGGSGGWRSLVTSRDISPTRGYIIYASPSNNWQFWVGCGPSSWQSVIGPAVTSDWTHLAGVCDGSQIIFYVNGQHVGSKSVSMEPNTARPLRIGSGNTETSPAYFFNGKIGEVRVWNSARSQAQIQAAMNSRINGKEEGLAGCWRLDEGQGNIANDLTANANHAAVKGGAIWKVVSDLQLEQAPSPIMVIKLDGTDDYVKAEGFQWPEGGPVTIEFWNKTGAADLKYSSAFSVGNQDNPNRFQAHAPWDNRILYWDYGHCGGTGRVSVDYSPHLDKWTHVALVSEGNGGSFMGIYLDGELVASSQNSDGPDIPLSGLWIGCWTNKFHKGGMAEFRIWNRVLAQSEIQANMSLPLIGNELNLAGYWPLRDGSGMDFGPGASNGQISGNPGTVPFDKVRALTEEVPALTALKLDGQDDYVDLGGIDFARGITLSRHGLPPPAVTRMFSLARSPAPTASFSKSTRPGRCAIFTAHPREPTTSRSVPKPPSMTGSGTMRHVSEAARTYSSMLTASPQAGTRARRTLTRQ